MAAHPALASHPCLCPSVSRWEGRTQCSVFDTSLVPVMLLDPWPWTQLLHLHQQLFSHLPFNIQTTFLCSMGRFRHETCMIPSSLGILLLHFFFSPKCNYLLLMNDTILKSLQDSVVSLWSKHKTSTCSCRSQPLLSGQYFYRVFSLVCTAFSFAKTYE